MLTQEKIRKPVVPTVHKHSKIERFWTLNEQLISQKSIVNMFSDLQ